MLKVECESCKAPYQIDERRVPPAGLKMHCPRCGHTFVVANPDADEPPTLGGVAGAGGPGGGGGRPAPAPTLPAHPAPASEPPRPARAPLPSDFPAALGSIDDGDLPVVSAALPAARTAADLPSPKRPAPPRPPPRPTVRDMSAKEADLPDVAAHLPEPRRGTGKSVPPPRGAPTQADLPVVAAHLPSPAAHLPSPVAHLPSAAVASLPVVAAHLPVASAPLPTVSAGLPVARGFGEINLPIVAESLPAMTSGERHLPAVSGRTQAGIGSFGEIELPRELSPGATLVGVGPDSGPPSRGGRDPSGDFQDLQLEEPRARGRSSSSGQPSAPDAGGMTFGEVDFSSGQGDSVGSDSALSVVAPFPKPDDGVPASMPTGGGEAALSSFGRPAVARALPRARVEVATSEGSTGKKVGLALAVAAVIGGAALQLTPYGAFGFVWVADRIHAKDNALSLSTTASATEKALGVDTYDQAKAAVDAAAAAHDRSPRARGLTAYASLVDAATAVRFGPDTARASRAKQLLAELPPDAVLDYRDVALAAFAASNDDAAGARKGLDAAAAKGSALPLPARVEASLLRGNLGLAQHDAAASASAFKDALALTDDARGHYGLARAYEELHDPAGAKKELEATLAASPGHPGALTLRAIFESPTDAAQAEKDLAVVLDGPSRARASTRELSQAYVARAAVSLSQDNPSQAREALDQATKLDPRNVEALLGQGRLLLDEGRSTEALARFDTALQIDPGRPSVIAFDAAAKIALDRLADAKAQLTEGHQKFPKDVQILVFLGDVEHHLGNEEAAETSLRSATALVTPGDLYAVEPYIALSELLSSRGRLDDAKAVLDEAKRKLPPSAVLDRAIGELAEQQGNYDLAIAQYRAALQRAPRDLASHFRLAVAMRRLRRFPEADAELDKVAKVDADYPGLSLERGLLFQESGDVQKAIAEFQRALAKAPDDPDLQLRVGSAYVSVGLPDNAIPMLRKVVQERPKSAEAYHYLGRALTLKGPSQQAEAMRMLKFAVDLDPNRAEFHVYLAWAANEATPAQLELAHDEIDKALALDKMNAEVYWQKGVLEQMEASIEDAIKDEKRALELRPSRYEAHATLAECYADRNDDAAAMGEWTKALAADGDTPGPDGLVRHPFWRYRFGKLLMDHGNPGSALHWLLPTAVGMEKSELRPAWLAPLEFLTAQALDRAGRRSEAADHYQKFLDGAPVSSPDRAEAQSALRRLGAK